LLGALLSSFIFMSSYIIAFGSDTLNEILQFGEKYASLTHFVNLNAIINVFGSFLLCSIIGPPKRLSDYLNFVEEFPRYFHSITGSFLILMCIFIFFLLFYFIIKERDLIQDCSILFIFLMIIFYLYFNPIEAILYSSQVLFPLTLIFSYVTSKIELNNKHMILIILIIILFINNIIILYYPL
jgi:hypothetical protein